MKRVGDNQVVIQYFKPSEILEVDANGNRTMKFLPQFKDYSFVSPMRQWKVSELELNNFTPGYVMYNGKKVPFKSPGFKNAKHMLFKGDKVVAVRKGGKVVAELQSSNPYGITNIIKSDPKGQRYGRYDGASVTFIFEDKKGNRIVRDFAGSVEGIKNEINIIAQSFNIPAGSITLGIHDIGSFSAKPAAKQGKLSTKAFHDYNPGNYTGGALAIPNTEYNSEAYKSFKEGKLDLQQRDQIIGEHGMTPYELGQLTQAKELQAKGISKETILQRTGMYEGIEGKWKSEIANATYTAKASKMLQDDLLLPMLLGEMRGDPYFETDIAGLFRAQEAEATANGDLKRAAKLREIFRKYDLNDQQKLVEISATPALITMRLGDVIKGPILQRYPHLKDRSVTFSPRPEGQGVRGVFHPATGGISIYTSVPWRDDFTLMPTAIQDGMTEALGVIHHEVQHMIQAEEGFQEGTNKGMFTNEVARARCSYCLRVCGEIYTRPNQKRENGL